MFLAHSVLARAQHPWAGRSRDTVVARGGAGQRAGRGQLRLCAWVLLLNQLNKRGKQSLTASTLNRTWKPGPTDTA